MFYHYYRTYSRKRNFYSALPKSLTLNYFPYSTNSLLFKDHNTCFREVKIDKYHMPKDIRQLHREIAREHHRQVNLFECYNSIKRVIFNNWNPNKLHIISHSAGYDSRIISKCIKELSIEHGKDWLGDTLFVETGGESEGFKAIMDHHGFNYEIIDDLGQFLDLETAWQKFNGVSAFPVNMFYDPFKQFPKDAQYFSGFGAYVENSLKNFRRWNSENYYYQMATFNTWGNWINPFWSKDYILTLCRHKPKTHKRTSEVVCNNLIPELKHIKRPKISDLQYRKLDNSLLRKVHNDYKQTWVGRKYRMNPDNVLQYSEYWCKWVVASICENLIKKGYHIR